VVGLLVGGGAAAAARSEVYTAYTRADMYIPAHTHVVLTWCAAVVGLLVIDGAAAHAYSCEVRMYINIHKFAFLEQVHNRQAICGSTLVCSSGGLAGGWWRRRRRPQRHR
jgi:hypothetical protein